MPSSTTSDTVRVSAEQLKALLSDSQACRPGERIPLGSVILQGGHPTRRAITFGKHGAAVFDTEEKGLLLFEPGKRVTKLGREGAGPGEFRVDANRVYGWAGDSIATFDFSASRISFFSKAGYLGSKLVGSVPHLASSTLLGRLHDGTLVFLVGTPIAPGKGSGIYRPELGIVGWNEKNPPHRIPAEIPGSEAYRMLFDGEMGTVRATFARTTNVGVGRDFVAIHDDAEPVVTLLAEGNWSASQLLYPFADSPVSQVDRDSAEKRIAAEDRRWQLPPKAAELRRRFPKTRAAMLWGGVDEDGGVWTAFHPPVSKSGVLYLRATVSGALDRCYRVPDQATVLAFSREKLVLARVTEAGDSISIATTVPLPGTKAARSGSQRQVNP